MSRRPRQAQSGTGYRDYAIPVAEFPGMESDADLLTTAQGRSVRVLCGQGHGIQRLANFPDEQEVQPQLGKQFIQQEVEALSRPSSRVEPVLAEPAAAEFSAESSQEVSGRMGALVIQRVETMNVYVSIVYGGNGAEPTLLTVPGR